MRTWFGIAAAGMLLVASGGCAKDPTTILTGVGTDDSVPALRLLRSRVVSTSDPSRVTGTAQTSSQPGDAADRPGPFVFPLALSITVDASLAGPVTVTVEGLDWDTEAVVASGSTSAEVVAGHETRAVVMLTATGAPPGDGGTDAN